jgi:Mrp family chromosome partitioning ATPase/uncharacterized protein involved in exopolysaccharide biosynthesis
MSIMKVRRTTPEQAMSKLREGQRMLNEGEDFTEVVRRLGITESTWDRWRNTYGDAEEPVGQNGGDIPSITINPDRVETAPTAPPLDRLPEMSGFDMGQFNPLTPLRQQPLIVGFFILVFLGLGALYATRLTPEFTASAGLVVEDTRRASIFETARTTDAERYIADQIAVLTSRAVAEQASELAPSLEPGAVIPVDDFLTNVSVSSDLRTDFLTITFTATDPTVAQVGANAVGRAYEQVVSARLAEDAANAVGRLNDAIDETVSAIVDIQADLESTQSGGVDRQLLEDQMAAIVAELADIRSGAETTDEIRAKADQLAAELQARLLLTEVEDSDPGVTLLRRRLEDALTLLSELTLLRSQLEVDAQLAGNGVALFSAAGPGRATGSSLTSILAVAAVLGGLVGIGVAYWFSERRRRIRNKMQPERVMGVPLLGEVPSMDSKVLDVELAVEAVPGSAGATAFHALVEEIRRELKERRGVGDLQTLDSEPLRGTIITIASPGFVEGKTVVAVNTALAAAKAGLTTLLIDADLLSQRASSLLSPYTSGSEKGLSEAVTGEARIKDVLLPVSLGGKYTIDLLRRGEGNLSWADLMSSPQAARVFDSLAEMYDLVVIDTAPLLHVPPARAAIQRADYALVVVRHRELVDSFEELLIRLNLMGVPTLGYVYSHPPRLRAG